MVPAATAIETGSVTLYGVTTLQRIKAIAAEIGRDPNALDFTAFGGEKQWRSTQEIRAFERAGKTLNPDKLAYIQRQLEARDQA